MWASCFLHPGPGLTQSSIPSGLVNEYRLRLGRYKAGMWDAVWCSPCTWAPLRWQCLLRGAITSARPLAFTFFWGGGKVYLYLFVLSENKRIKPITEILGDKEVGEGQHSSSWALQFHFHFSRVDFLLCEDDTALQNSTADPQNKTSSSQNV